MDRMDDIWKDRFNSEDLPLGEWNTPDDMIWQNIANDTVRKKGKRRAIVWLWAVTGLLVLLLGITLLNSGNFLSSFNNSNDKNSVTGQLTEMTSKDDFSKNVSSKSVSQKYYVPPTNKTATQQLTLIQSNDVVSSKQVSKDKTPKQTKTFSLDKKIINPTTSNRQVQQNNINIELANELTIKKEAIPASIQPDLTSIRIQENSKTNIGTAKEINPLTVFNTATLSLLSTEAAIKEVQLNVKNDLKEPKNTFPISVTATIGASHWKHVISKNYTSDLSAFDFNYTDEFGYLLDLDVAVPIGKRFAITTGLSYEQINISSGHNSALNYNPADEDVDQSNAYALSLATPYGLAGAEFRFDRSEDIGDNPVELLVDFHSAHTIKNFSIPLNVEYYPIGKNRIVSPILKAGMGINYLSGISNKIKAIDTHHDAIQFDDSGNSSFMAPNITKWHYDYRLGLGARIQWRNDFAIILNYERVGGINSIFKQDAYNTRINRQHLSIGLNKVLLNLR